MSAGARNRATRGGKEIMKTKQKMDQCPLCHGTGLVQTGSPEGREVTTEEMERQEVHNGFVNSLKLVNEHGARSVLIAMETVDGGLGFHLTRTVNAFQFLGWVITSCQLRLMAVVKDSEVIQGLAAMVKGQGGTIQ